MALKAGRVGVAPDQVDDFGKINSEATSGYTKQEADAKFETQTHAASTYETKSDATTAIGAKQNIQLQAPVHLLDGSALTVESALQGLNIEKFTYADNGILGAKNLLPYPIGTKQVIGSDGTISANADMYLSDFIDIGNAKAVIFSGTKVGEPYIRLAEYNSSKEFIQRPTDSTVPKTFNLNSNTRYVRVCIEDSAGTKFTDPMLRIATDGDSEYQPYAMTNKALTEFKIKLDTELLQASSFADFKQRMSN